MQKIMGVKMNKLKYIIYNLFQRRYGIDELYKFLFVAFILIWILNSFVKSPFLYYLGMIICIFMIFRMFSKNFEKREKENIRYIQIRDKIKGKTKIQRQKWNDRKSHIYRKCPNCKAEIRLPKKKGKHICTCPCCKKDFNVKC